MMCRKVRPTDADPDLAAKRYDVYEESKAALISLNDALPVITIDASGNINEVRHAIGTALYTYERAWNTQCAADADQMNLKPCEFV
jgi:hypothetical protein